MNCNIKYNKNNSGIEYWCLSHKTKATSINGKIPIFCDCQYKDRILKFMDLVAYALNWVSVLATTIGVAKYFAYINIKSIKIIYSNLKNNTNVKLFINNQEFLGIVKIENSIIDLKDYGGILLSKLNNINLESSKCPYCNKMHTDNGILHIHHIVNIYVSIVDSFLM